MMVHIVNTSTHIRGEIEKILCSLNRFVRFGLWRCSETVRESSGGVKMDYKERRS